MDTSACQSYSSRAFQKLSIDLGWNKKWSVLLLDVKSVFYLAINTYVCEFRSMLHVGCA